MPYRSAVCRAGSQCIDTCKIDNAIFIIVYDGSVGRAGGIVDRRWDLRYRRDIIDLVRFIAGDIGGSGRGKDGEESEEEEDGDGESGSGAGHRAG